jgi:pilus assembly protein CpaE
MTTRTIVVVEPDPYLAVSVEALLSDLRPPVELVAVADLDELEEWVQPTGVVVIGPANATRSGVDRLRDLRDRYPALRMVLAFDRRPGAAMREVVAAGADALVDPGDRDELRAAVLRSLRLAEQLAALLQEADEAEAAPVGEIFTVCSATGGSGKTFFSTNTAVALARLTGRKVALLDLDLQFGEVLTSLRLKPTHTIVDAIAIDDATELETYLPDMLTEHEDGVWVLPAPLDPVEADNVQPRDVVRLIEVLQRHFDYVVVDTPTGLGEHALAALDRSAHLFVLASLDLASIRNLRLFLQTLDRLRIPSEGVSVILNKDERGIGLDAGEVERLFPSGFRARIPFSREVPRSMNVGQPLVTAAPTSVVSARLVDSIADLLPPSAASMAAELSAAATPTPWFKRAFRRSPRPTEDVTRATAPA